LILIFLRRMRSLRVYYLSFSSTCVYSFFFQLPRSPRSTLFPYTTLFRSAEGEGERGVAERGDAVGGEVQLGEPALGGADGGGSPDRKSTRLNSSHQIISYAVFCLKKKRSLQNIIGSHGNNLTESNSNHKT